MTTSFVTRKILCAFTLVNRGPCDGNLSRRCCHRFPWTLTNFPGWVLLLPPISGVGDSLSQEPTTLAPLVSRTRMLRSFPEMPFISALLTEISPPTRYSRPSTGLFLPTSPEPWLHLESMPSSLAFNSPVHCWFCLPSQPVHFLHMPWASHSARNITFSYNLRSLLLENPWGNRGSERVRDFRGAPGSGMAEVRSEPRSASSKAIFPLCLPPPSVRTKPGEWNTHWEDGLQTRSSKGNILPWKIIPEQ